MQLVPEFRDGEPLPGLSYSSTKPLPNGWELDVHSGVISCKAGLPVEAIDWGLADTEFGLHVSSNAQQVTVPMPLTVHIQSTPHDPIVSVHLVKQESCQKWEIVHTPSIAHVATVSVNPEPSRGLSFDKAGQWTFLRVHRQWL